jgi:hypothetical protein
LTAVVEGIRLQRARLAAVVETVTGVRERLAMLTQGSRHPLVMKMLASWNAALAKLNEADQTLAHAASAVLDYAEQIGLHIGSAPVAEARPAAPVRLTATGVGGEPVPAFVHEAAAKLRWPQPGTGDPSR